MFDIGASELLLVAMVALVVIGPKDLPVAHAHGRTRGSVSCAVDDGAFSHRH